jgi:branched-subunit amino acid transport protein AzlD
MIFLLIIVIKGTSFGYVLLRHHKIDLILIYQSVAVQVVWKLNFIVSIHRGVYIIICLVNI